jgi:hypothetical protein
MSQALATSSPEYSGELSTANDSMKQACFRLLHRFKASLISSQFTFIFTTDPDALALSPPSL